MKEQYPSGSMKRTAQDGGIEVAVRQHLRPDFFAALAIELEVSTDEVVEMTMDYGATKQLDPRLKDAVATVLGTDSQQAQQWFENIVRGTIDENTARFIDEKLNASRREILRRTAWLMLATAIAAQNPDWNIEKAKTALVEEMADGISDTATRLLCAAIGDDAPEIVSRLQAATTVEEVQAIVQELRKRFGGGETE